MLVDSFIILSDNNDNNKYSLSLLGIKNCSKSFTCINSFNFHHNPMKWELFHPHLRNEISEAQGSKQPKIREVIQQEHINLYS